MQSSFVINFIFFILSSSLLCVQQLHYIIFGVSTINNNENVWEQRRLIGLDFCDALKFYSFCLLFVEIMYNFTLSWKQINEHKNNFRLQTIRCCYVHFLKIRILIWVRRLKKCSCDAYKFKLGFLSGFSIFELWSKFIGKNGKV